MAGTLLFNALLLFIYMTLAYAVGYARKRLDTVDVAWGLGFIVVAWSSVLRQPSGHSWLITALVTVWGLRLASHIGRRARKSSEDPRYKELSSKWHGNFWLRAYFSIFLLQGALILIVSLPVSMATNQSLDGWGWLSILGAVIWFKGFVIESAADRQLRNFLATPNHPKVLRTGLWRYSRHPNYFGELTQWFGIAVVALQVRYGWIGLLGPVTLSILIIFISGIPPIERRRAKDADYREYQRQTSVLLPLPPRRA